MSDIGPHLLQRYGQSEWKVCVHCHVGMLDFKNRRFIEATSPYSPFSPGRALLETELGLMPTLTKMPY